MHLPRLLATATFRLALLQTVLFALCASVLFGVVYTTVLSFARRQLEAAIIIEMSSLMGEDDPAGRGELIASLAARSRDRAGEGRFYRLQAANGGQLAGNLPALDPTPAWREWQVVGSAVSPPDDEPHTILIEARGLSDGSVLFVGRDMRDASDLEEVLQQTFGWTALAALGLAIFSGVVTSRGFLKRIEAINATTRAIITGGDMAARIPVRGSHDEFDILAANLNGMLTRIETLMEGLRQVSSDIAHDLRTPLTHMRQRLELARGRPSSAADYDAVIEATIADTDTVLRTFAALLRIAQIEAGTRLSGFTAVDLSEVCATIVEIYAPVAEDNGQILSGAIAPDVTVVGDRELLTQMLANLTENAIRHAPAGTRIGITLAAHDGRPTIVVEDNGPGIPERDREKVFARFVRGDQSCAVYGSGLGLSLVRAVAELHEVALALEDASPGLKVVLRFTAVPALLRR